MAKSHTAVKKQTGTDLYTRLGHLLDARHTFLIILCAGIVLAVMNFNARISEAHDDSLYIEAGYRFVHEFPNYYYTSNAPLYPMFLALLTLVFGIKLIIFKCFSIVFFIAGAVMYYRALDGRVPSLLKYFVLLFLCINHLILYYSSQTFSEAFYMMIQATFYYYFLKYNFGENPLQGNIKTEYRQWMVLGFLLMVLTLAKNILVFGVAAVALFFILRKEYKKAVHSVISFGIFKMAYEFIKNLIWGESAIQYKSQMGILLNKDPYDASKGQEDIAGFIGRFTDNIGLYLGKRVYQILGLMEEDNFTVSYLLAFIVLGLTFYGLYRAVKDRQNAVAFLVFFAGTVAFGTFLVLQARWDQPRFIMVHMPALLLGIFYGLYRLLHKNQALFVALLLLLSGSMLVSSLKRGVKNIPVVTKNLKGDIYYGYTPDWKNFLEASAWCGDSLPDNALVASRKAPMSFVYGNGKHFYPIYSVIAKDTLTQQSNPDSALAIFKRNGVTHILIASLRLNPKQNTGDVINTVHHIVTPIVEKYPRKIREVKLFGYDEPAAVYEIRYDD